MSDSQPGLFERPTVRAGLVAAVVVILAYAAKLYKDHAPTPLSQTQKTASDGLQAAFGALEEAAKAAKDFESYKKTLPTTTSWYPALPCGEMTQEYGARPKDWKSLPTSWAKGKTAYSYRFHQTPTHLYYIARRDRDCDGLYEVQMLKVSSTWTGGMDKTISEVHNPGE